MSKQPTEIGENDILRGVTAGERYAPVPDGRPAGEILLRLSGWRKVDGVLQAIDIVKNSGGEWVLDQSPA